MKLEKIFFYSLILFYPTQLGKHFWPSFAFVDGLRIDYLSPTLYLTDILLILLIACYFYHRIATHKVKIFSLQFSKYKLQIAFFVVLLIGIITSHSPLNGVYVLVKLFEYIFLTYYIIFKINKKDFLHITVLLAIGVSFESLLAIAQFIKGSSVGGIFWFFGERTFSGQTPGIANADINGRLILRPYGTFPHPNVLSGFLTIAMTIIILNFKKRFFYVPLLLGIIALLLTLSRVGILLFISILFFWFFRHVWKTSKNKLFTFLSALLLLLFVIIFIFATPLSTRFLSVRNSDSQSFTQRQDLANASLKMFQSSPIFGVGLGNFLPQLPNYITSTAGPQWLQPVHNIFLLVLAETGIVGLFFFILLFVKMYKNMYFLLFALIVVLGFFDHYLLTLQQGQLLFALSIGILFNKKVEDMLH